MPVVEIPNVGTVEFPDSMTGAQIQEAARNLYTKQISSPQRTPEQVGQAMRDRYPQAFENPNAPQNWGDVAERLTINDIYGGPIKGLINTVKSVWNDPKGAIKSVVLGNFTEGQKALEAYQRGDMTQAAAHGMAAAIPFVGPAAAAIGESADVNHPGEVVGNAGMLAALSTQGGSQMAQEAGAAVRDAASASGPYIKAAVKGAAKGAASPAGERGATIGAAAGAIANGRTGAEIGGLVGATPSAVRGAASELRNLIAQKRAEAFGKLREQVKAAREAAKPAPVSAEPSVLPPPAPMPAQQPMVDIPGPSGTFVDVPAPPPAPGNIQAPQAPSILDIKRADAMQRLNPQAAPVAEAPRFDPRSLPPDPIKSQPWYGDAVAAMKARRVGAPEVAPVETVNPAVADESQVGMIRQMAQERTPNALADAFRNITPEQRAEVIKAFDRERIVAAQDAMRQQMKAQGFDAETAELAAQTEARPDFTDTVPARIAKARANKAEGLFKTAREMGINPDKMAKLSPAKWEEIAAKAGVRKPTWTANGSETVREVIQMAREWEAKNGPIQAPPKPMKKPSVTPGGLDTPEKIAAARALAEVLANEK